MDEAELAAVEQASKDGAVVGFFSLDRLLLALPREFDRAAVRHAFEQSGPCPAEGCYRLAHVACDDLTDGRAWWKVCGPGDGSAGILIVRVSRQYYGKVIAHLRELAAQKRAAIGLN